MPHCVIEYSSPLADKVTEDKLLEVVFDGALDSALFDIQAIKCRVIGYQSYFSKAQVSDFIHVTLRIMAGRTIEQKSLLSHSVLQQLKALKLTDISITVDICDIETQCYAKVIC